MNKEFDFNNDGDGLPRGDAPRNDGDGLPRRDAPRNDGDGLPRRDAPRNDGNGSVIASAEGARQSIILSRSDVAMVERRGDAVVKEFANSDIGIAAFNNERKILKHLRRDVEIDEEGMRIASKFSGGELGKFKFSNSGQRMRALKGLLRAVGQLHAQRVLHNDLKPNNILMYENLNLTLIDFGTSTILNERSAVIRSLGSKYTAPELRGENWEPSRASDIYSIGVIAKDIFRDCKMPKRVSKFADRACCKNPEMRFQSAGEALAHLESRLPKPMLALPILLAGALGFTSFQLLSSGWSPSGASAPLPARQSQELTCEELQTCEILRSPSGSQEAGQSPALDPAISQGETQDDFNADSSDSIARDASQSSASIQPGLPRRDAPRNDDSESVIASTEGARQSILIDHSFIAATYKNAQIRIAISIDRAPALRTSSAIIQFRSAGGIWQNLFACDALYEPMCFIPNPARLTLYEIRMRTDSVIGQKYSTALITPF